MVDGYDYGDWLSCPECDNSEIWVETVKRLSESRPPNTDQLQIWLRFKCHNCDYQSRDFESSEVMPSF